MASVAFSVSWRMKFGFANCENPVMALAAVTEHLLVVNIGGDIPCERGVTGFATVAGSDVVLRLGRDRTEIVVVAIGAA